MGDIQDLRESVGPRPLIMVGSAVVSVDQRGQLLMIRRTDNGLWGLPGGALEPGETLEAAAQRELGEETGLTATSLEMLSVLSGAELFYEYPNGDQVHNVVAVFLAGEVEGVAQPCNVEASEVRRFPLDRLPKNLDPVDKQSIHSYVAARPTPIDS